MSEEFKLEPKVVIIILMFVLLGFIGGYLLGYSGGIGQGLNACVNVVNQICEKQFLEPGFELPLDFMDY